MPCLIVRTPSRTLDKYGHGAGGTRNIAGTGSWHVNLEKEVAALHRKSSALVFSSCYVANDATLSTLGAKLPDCVYFSDSSNHASMIQGIRHSGAKKVIWKHNDLSDLENKLKEWPKETPKIIAFESVYSMCGSVGPIKEICDLAEKYGAITFLDEVCPARSAVSPMTHLCMFRRFMLSACTAPEVPVLQNILITMSTRLPVNRWIPSRVLSWIVWTLYQVRYICRCTYQFAYGIYRHSW